MGTLRTLSHMPRLSTSFAAIRATADAQLGLITAAQLAEIGVHRSTTSRRSAGGMWTRVLPGDHLVGGGTPSRQQRLLAALLYAGDGSVLTGTTALRGYGFRALGLAEARDDDAERPEPVHVLVDHERRRLSTGFVRVERTRRDPGSVRVAGFPSAPVARAVGDAARRIPRERDVLALVAEALQRRRCSWEDLEREAVEGPMRGSAHLRAALRATESGAHSVPEADVASLLDEACVPCVMLNVRLVSGNGAFIAIPDAWLDDVGLAIEVDSEEYHARGDGFERTVRRNARYAAAGVTAITLLPVDIRDRPRAVIKQVLSAREAAAGRPRPPVTAIAELGVSAGSRAWPWGA